jgi:dynein heavy chain 1
VQEFNTLAKPTTDNQDPLYRLFHREGEIGSRLLKQVRRDLGDVIKVCEGSLKQTNHLRELISSLTKSAFVSLFGRCMHADMPATGTIPTHWRKYKVPRSTSVAEWIPNLARRLGQLARVAERGAAAPLGDFEVWLGGLFFPEAYVTATRQAIAHRRRWSLETLHLRVDIERVNDPEAFVVDGLVLQGAAWAADRLVLNDGDAVRLGASQLRWVQADAGTALPGSVTLPVYLNDDRSDVLFTVELPFAGDAGAVVAMRAVCLTASG